MAKQKYRIIRLRAAAYCVMPIKTYVCDPVKCKDCRKTQCGAYCEFTTKSYEAKHFGLFSGCIELVKHKINNFGEPRVFFKMEEI